MNRRAVKRSGKDGAEFIEIRQFTVQEKSRPYQIWYIPTHAAAQYYGRTYKDVFVPWCISTQNPESFKQTYSESNFYFLICLDQSLKKSKNFKIAVQVNLDGTVYLNDIKNQPGTCVIPQISEYFKQNFEWKYQQSKKYNLTRLKKYQPEIYKRKFMLNFTSPQSDLNAEILNYPGTEDRYQIIRVYDMYYMYMYYGTVTQDFYKNETVRKHILQDKLNAQFFTSCIVPVFNENQ